MSKVVLSSCVGFTFVAVGVVAVEALAWLGWTVGGWDGRDMALAWAGYVGVALVLMLWLRLVAERRGRVGRGASRHDRLALLARGLAMCPCRIGVQDAARGGCWAGARFFPPRFRRRREAAEPQPEAHEQRHNQATDS